MQHESHATPEQERVTGTEGNFLANGRWLETMGRISSENLVEGAKDSSWSASRPGILSMSVTRKFTCEMDKLRLASFPHLPGVSGSEDEFDINSYHILAHLDEVLVGMARTTQPASVVRSWLRTPRVLPQEESSVDLTRAAVYSRVQGKGIFKLLLTEQLAWAHEHGVLYAIALVEPEKTLNCLLKMGFKDKGSCRAWHSPGRGDVSGVLVVADLRTCWPLVVVSRREVESCLMTIGLRVISPQSFR